jgi:hypothetical protein
MHPNTPIFKFGFSFLVALIAFKRVLTFCSAFSLMAQVFIRTKSASASMLVVE